MKPDYCYCSKYYTICDYCKEHSEEKKRYQDELLGDGKN